MLRAKFRCVSVTTHADGSEAVQLQAVYGDKEGVNAQWAKFTPSGSLSMTISAEGAQGKLVPGVEYFIDFSVASPAEGS